MIDKALITLRSEANAYLSLKNGVTEDKIVLSNVATENGGWAIPEDKLGMSLVKVEEERVFKDQKMAHRNSKGQFDFYNPELKFNLYVLVTANFPNGDTDATSSKYTEGLKQLSHIITFFQQKHVFTPANTPTMAASELEKLIVELYYYGFEQQDNLWTVIGAKYLPSVLYRVRVVRVQEAAVKEQGPPISDISLNLLGS
ncbi:MAG: DUF4255 domain-containing protein [Flavobacteriales bacterium]|nr:DUF4255 domain-containing protein [Flavobacteriales bacterium]MCB9448590.1 DUF4255 domain-containing protein [Flavobacteriales bacterium]